MTGQGRTVDLEVVKPPFRVPLMSELDDIEPNGLTVASTFSGGGGSCTGYRIAGFKVLWANEFEPNAQLTYAANHPTTLLDTRDIRTIHAGDILDAVGPVDLFDGSPPCQSFSTAGRRHKSWGKEMAHADGTTQRSDDLFFEYGRILRELQPRAFIAENVRGMVMGAAKGYFKEIHAMLVDAGYRVESRIVDAQWLGVPQRRKRLIFIGIRADLGLEPEFPSPLPYRYSVNDACPWIIEQGRYKSFDDWDKMVAMGSAETEPSPTITAAHGPIANVKVTGRMWGTERDDIELDTPFPTVIAAGASQNRFFLERPYRDLTWQTWAHRTTHEIDEPSPTIMASGIDGVRPGHMPLSDGVEKRQLTIEEVRRICAFPDDYVLHGSYMQQWARLGNSVPPVMMGHVARAVAATLARAPAPKRRAANAKKGPTPKGRPRAMPS